MLPIVQFVCPQTPTVPGTCTATKCNLQGQCGTMRMTNTAAVLLLCSCGLVCDVLSYSASLMPLRTAFSAAVPNAGSGRVVGVCPEPRKAIRRVRTGVVMSAGADASKAEILADELREELPQLFDLSYSPKWDLYEEKVCRPCVRARLQAHSDFTSTLTDILTHMVRLSLSTHSTNFKESASTKTTFSS